MNLKQVQYTCPICKAERYADFDPARPQEILDKLYRLLICNDCADMTYYQRQKKAEATKANVPHGVPEEYRAPYAD